MLLTLLTVTCLNGALLYPLFMTGTGRRLSWFWEGGMIVAGLFGFYLLVKYRRQL